MTLVYKRWTQLGVGAAALGAASLGACGEGGESGEHGETGNALSAAHGEAGEGEHGGEAGEGEAGEGGEGGVDVALAASDPAEYRAGLAVVEAHVRAAKDAYDAGKRQEAAAMFAHPVSEVLIDLGPILADRGVAPIDGLLLEASEAAYGDATPEDIAARADAVLTALLAAERQAPDDGSSAGEIAARVAADQIERAVRQYRQALRSDAYEPYLDGFGYYKTADAALARSAGDLGDVDTETREALRVAIELLAEAYPSAQRPPALEVDAGALTAASSTLQLLVP